MKHTIFPKKKEKKKGHHKASTFLTNREAEEKLSSHVQAANVKYIHVDVPYGLSLVAGWTDSHRHE